ncbi:MAG: hypothetical protein ACE5G5_09260 [Candidatus Methylomirabilales bacterium]
MYTANKQLVATCFMLAIAFTVPACAPVKAYSGPELPPDQVAIISASYPIEALDGNELEGDFFGLNRDVAVKPGWHTLKLAVVSCSDIYTGSTLLTICYDVSFVTLSLEAEASHTYHVRRNGSLFWIEDEETEEVVAGHKPE